MPYDVRAAEEAGLTKQDIIGYLIKKRGRGYDVQGAREAGLDDDAIIHYLDTGKSFDASPGGRVGVIPRAMNNSIADAVSVVGLPVDAANWVADKFGYGVDNPTLGSANISSKVKDLINAGGEALGGTPGKMTFRDQADLPPAERPYAVGGKFLGDTIMAAIPFVGAGRVVQGTAKTAEVAGETVGQIPRALANTGSIAATDAPKGLLSMSPWLPKSMRGGDLVGSSLSAKGTPRAVLDPILNAARNSPAAFLGAEAATGAVAGAGAGVADALFPDNKLAQSVGSLAAPLAPSVVASRALRPAVGGLRRAYDAYLSPSGIERQAGEKLLETIKARGENVDDILRAMDTDVPEGVDLKLSAGQWSNSPALLGLEKKLSEDGSDAGAAFGARLKENVSVSLRNTFDAIKHVERVAATSGNPADLVSAARLRAEGFNTLASRRLALRDQRATETRQLLERGMIDKQTASTRLYNVIEGADSDMRKVQNELWGAVDRTVPVPVDSTLAAFAKARDMTNQPLPGYMRLVERKLSAGQPVTVKDLLKVRSDGLAAQRDFAAGKGGVNRVQANQMGVLADAALADLNKVQGPEAQVARQFTKAYHDHFSRGYAGRVLDTDATGAGAVMPELVGEKAFGAGKNVADVRFRQMQDAADFADRGGSVGASAGMQSAQEDFVRTAASQVVDPVTGQVDPNKVKRFLYNNSEIVDRFPGLRQQMEDAGKAQTLFSSAQKVPVRASQILGANTPFGKLLRGADPIDAVDTALKGAPRDYTALVSLARKADYPAHGRRPEAGTPALDGLRSATHDALIRDATDSTGKLNFGKLKESLMGGERPMLNRMVSQMNMDANQASRIQMMLTRAERIAKAAESGAFSGSLYDGTDFLSDIAPRMAGTFISSKLPGKDSLVRIGAFSRLGQKLASRLPQQKMNEVLRQAMDDKAVLRLILERPTSPARRAEIERQLNAAFIQSGILPLEDDSPQSQGSGNADTPGVRQPLEITVGRPANGP